MVSEEAWSSCHRYVACIGMRGGLVVKGNICRQSRIPALAPSLKEIYTSLPETGYQASWADRGGPGGPGPHTM